jgi:hypothetical protein
MKIAEGVNFPAFRVPAKHLDAGRFRSPKAPTRCTPHVFQQGETMPILTIEAIRENPWNVLSHELPPNPSLLLLRLARMAADYCRRSENLLMFAVSHGHYLPSNGRSHQTVPMRTNSVRCSRSMLTRNIARSVNC